MKLFLLKAALLSLLSSSAFAFTVEEFGWSLENLDRQYAHLTFEDAFKCGQKATFQSAKFMCKETCQDGGLFSMCQSECVDPNVISEIVTQEVVNCSSDSVTIFSSDGDIRTITRDLFIKYKKNPLRELLHQSNSFRDGIEKVVISHSYPGQHTLGWKTEDERKVNATFFRGTYEGGSSNEFRESIFTVIVDSSIPWFAQAARIRIEEEGTYWRLQDVLE